MPENRGSYFLEQYIPKFSNHSEAYVCKNTEAEILYLIVGCNKLRFQSNMIFLYRKINAIFGFLVLRYYYDIQSQNHIILGTLPKKCQKANNISLNSPSALKFGM